MANKKLDMNKLSLAAADYVTLQAQIKKLEAEAKIIKDEIVSDYLSSGISDTLDLGELLVIPSQRTTQKLNQAAATPDWIYRFRQAGGTADVKLTLPEDDSPSLAALLDEVSFKATTSRVITLKASSMPV